MSRSGEQAVLDAHWPGLVGQSESAAGLCDSNVGFAAEQRQIERLADLVAGAHVIDMGVGEHMGPQRQTTDLPQDARGRVARAGIQQHVSHHIGVERASGSPGQEPQAVCHALSARDIREGDIREGDILCRIHTGQYATAMTRSVKQRLSSEDWERTALEAIATGGLAAVSVEPLARRLGVTKGSFYAHFNDRDELVHAALRRWEQAHIDAFLASVQQAGDPAERLLGLITLATSAARTKTIQARLLLESDDPRVREALKRVTEVRLARLEAIFAQLGHAESSAARRSTIAYATYIGLLQLAREVPERLADEAELAADLLLMLTAS